MERFHDEKKMKNFLYSRFVSSCIPCLFACFVRFCSIALLSNIQGLNLELKLRRTISIYRTCNIIIKVSSIFNTVFPYHYMKLIPFLHFSFLQSQLSHIGESRMEKDFKLCENEGLFQEYLEMGKNNIVLNDIECICFLLFDIKHRNIC